MTSQPAEPTRATTASPASPESDTAGRRPTRDRPFRLTGSARRLVRLGHLVAALGWFGVDVAFGVLVVTGFTSDDPGTVAASYRAIDIFVVPLLLVFGMTTLGSGLVLSIAGGWGIVRYWWVAAKLLINVILSGLVLVLLRSRVAAAGAEAVRVDVTLADRLGDLRVDLLFPPLVSGVALLAAALLGTFKPWGRTPFARGRATRGRAS